MSDDGLDEGVVTDISTPEGDAGEAVARPQGDSAFVEEEGEHPERESESDGGEEPEKEAEAPSPAEIERRLVEKERQAQGLTNALREERRLRRIAEDRFYQVIDRAIAATASAGRGEATEDETQTEPDPETDAAGAILHKIGGLEQRLEAERNERLLQAQEAHVEATVADAEAFLVEDAERFSQTAPDYDQAEKFVAGRIFGAIEHQLKMQNPGADPASIDAAAREVYADQLAKIHIEHARTRTSFARSVYEMARAMGWNGKAPAARPAPDPLAKERQRLAAGRSLSQANGPAPRRASRPKDAVNMTDEEFDNLMSSGKVNFRALAEALASE